MWQILTLALILATTYLAIDLSILAFFTGLGAFHSAQHIDKDKHDFPVYVVALWLAVGVIAIALNLYDSWFA